MRLNRIFPLILSTPLLLVSCKSNSDDLYLSRPKDTNLEFWITQRVSSTDLINKGCTYLPGWMGAEEYLDSRYEAIDIENMAKAPEIHVTYLLTGYPDLLDEVAITQIEITDPNITVYGLKLGASDNEITSRLSSLASSFSYVTTITECYLSIHIKNCTFNFMSEKIVIAAKTTNNDNIEY